MRFPANLRRARLAKGLTQAELALAVDHQLRAVQHWEAGTSEPPLPTLRRLATALEVTVASLVEEQEP